MNKILVFGASGLVGSRFLELADSSDILAPKSSEVDITKRHQVQEYVNIHRPSVVINFAAFTDVGLAQEQKADENGACYQINVAGVQNIIDCVKDLDTFLVHISTDMVFTGSLADPGPYPETKPPETDANKLTWYGYTKALSEQIIKQQLPDSAIVRIAYPVRAKFTPKQDFLRRSLDLFDQGKLYPLFDDQQITVTFIDDLCHAINHIVEIEASGIYHVSSLDLTSPYEMVSYLIQKARGQKDGVKKGSLKEFLKDHDPVRYPVKGGLLVQDTQKILGIKFSPAREIVNKLIEQGIAES